MLLAVIDGLLTRRLESDLELGVSVSHKKRAVSDGYIVVVQVSTGRCEVTEDVLRCPQERPASGDIKDQAFTLSQSVAAYRDLAVCESCTVILFFRIPGCEDQGSLLYLETSRHEVYRKLLCYIIAVRILYDRRACNHRCVGAGSGA